KAASSAARVPPWSSWSPTPSRASPSAIPACCPTSSARARAWSPKVSWMPPAASSPTPFWPSTTRPTCRPRWPRPSRSKACGSTPTNPRIGCRNDGWTRAECCHAGLGRRSANRDPRPGPRNVRVAGRLPGKCPCAARNDSCERRPMIIELGHFALVLALPAALVQMLLPAWGAHARDERFMAVAEPAALVQLSLVLFSFLALTHAYVTSDFSVEAVWANSHSAKPLLYKVSGVWGNHEGSMLLWVLILAVFGAGVALFGGNLPATLRANVLSVQAAIAVAFLAFIVLASNPFLRIPPQPEGRGLNPILQDPALAFHPPFLYAGYVGLSVAFSFAIAALIEGRTDAAWARWVRPWTLAAWICLTLGIAMGSWWAYYELGWGGWWFWDPVENASFMPWLSATALLHSALVMEKREALKV